ncbi:MAG: hypothetical protein MUO72_15580 [Bacteroidales bacterium]|nr:hypothetical protein [Bacteroidales bacterium]
MQKPLFFRIILIKYTKDENHEEITFLRENRTKSSTKIDEWMNSEEEPDMFADLRLQLMQVKDKILAEINKQNKQVFQLFRECGPNHHLPFSPHY